jgi:hypothetical protein
MKTLHRPGLMRALGGMGCVVLLLSAGVPAHAQRFEAEPSQALACLTPAGAERGQPAYPQNRLKRQERGRVLVRLSFDDPGLPPQV